MNNSKRTKLNLMVYKLIFCKILNEFLLYKLIMYMTIDTYHCFSVKIIQQITEQVVCRFYEKFVVRRILRDRDVLKMFLSTRILQNTDENIKCKRYIIYR